METFSDALRSWQTFYFTCGGASAALIGLMFVALSLGMPLLTSATPHDIKTFTSPSVYYFMAVLLLSGAMLIPQYSPPVLGLLLLAGGILAVVQILPFVVRLVRTALRNKDFNLGDWLLQVIIPAANLFLLFAAATCFLTDQWSWGFMCLWATTMLFLVVGIANTWSLVIWILEKKNAQG